jgi:hypothetical protein
MAAGCAQKRVDVCASFKQKGIDSQDWKTLMQEGAQCLTRDEYRLLSNATGLVLVKLGKGKTVGEIISEERELEKWDPETVQRSVVFLYASNDKGTPNEDAPLATAFIVAIPSGKDPKRTLLLLLTSRHVFDPDWANCGISNPQRLFIRMNKRSDDSHRTSSGVGFALVELIRKGKRLYAVSPDDAVDVAAVVLPTESILFQNYDVQFIPISAFATDEEVQNLKIHDPIVTAGLVTSIEKGAQTRNDPAFQAGFISAQTSNKVIRAYCTENIAKQIKVWLISPPLERGYSGAPIFAPVTGRLEGQLTKGVALIGLQSMRLGKADQVGGMTPVYSIIEVVKEITKSLPEANIGRNQPVATRDLPFR